VDESRSRGYQEKIDLTLGNFSTRAAQAGRTVPMMLAALSAYDAGIAQVVIAGDAADALVDVVRSRYRPTMIAVRIGSGTRNAIAQRLPWVTSLAERDGRATAYLCREFACQAPTNDPLELARQLDKG
jgi:uncharacterized protein YyaL (SSP411 family)